MISFRYHVVSILAVLLALAAGVALGGGPLSEIGRGDEAARKAEARNAELRADLAAAEQAGSFQDAFAGALGARSVTGELDGRTVSLVAFPGADADVVKGLDALVEQAGGRVSGRYAVQPALVDPGESALVDTLGAQLRQSVETTVPASATTYERLGGLLGRAVATGYDAGPALDAPAQEILGSLESAGLVVPESDQAMGSVVLVVLGDEPADPEQLDDVYAGLLRGLASRPDALVLAGSTSSAEEGLLSVLRDDRELSAVLSSADSVQTTAGRVAAVLAAAAGAAGETGHYGATGNDGALPRG